MFDDASKSCGVGLVDGVVELVVVLDWLIELWSCGVGCGVLSHVHIAGTVLERSIFRGLPGDFRTSCTYWTGWGILGGLLHCRPLGLNEAYLSVLVKLLSRSIPLP